MADTNMDGIYKCLTMENPNENLDDLGVHQLPGYPPF